MGFRNPITAAAAVDTGNGNLANAGVRLFQDLSTPAVPQGIAEWRTGKMSRNARITLSGGGSGGSSFLIDGGNAGVGADAPALALNVESAPAGGYQGAAVLRNAARYDLGGALLSGAAVPAVAAVAAFAGWGVITAAPPGIFRTAEGVVFLRGWLQNLNTFSPAGGEVLAVLPSGFWPTTPKLFELPVSVGQTVIQVNIGTDGKVAIARPSGTSIAAGSVWSFDDVHYLP